MDTILRYSSWYYWECTHFLLYFWKSSLGPWWWRNSPEKNIIRWNEPGPLPTLEPIMQRRIPSSCLVQTATHTLLHEWYRPPNHSPNLQRYIMGMRRIKRHRRGQHALRSENVDVELCTGPQTVTQIRRMRASYALGSRAKQHAFQRRKRTNFETPINDRFVGNQSKTDWFLYSVILLHTLSYELQNWKTM